MPANLKLISAQTNLSGSSLITFDNIPQTYDDLYILWSGRENIHNGHLIGKMTFNNDYTNNYSDLYGYSGGSSASTNSGSNSNVSYNTQGMWNANGSTSNTFSNSDIYIPQYKASGNKTYFSYGYGSNNGTGDYSSAFIMAGGTYSGSSAITRIDFYSYQGTYSAYDGTSFYLYGIKNS